MHHIRVEIIEKLILEAIHKVSGYVLKNEVEFVERVREESALQQETAVKEESRKKLTKSKRRHDEISGLVKKLHESYAADKIPEKHFRCDMMEEELTRERERDRRRYTKKVAAKKGRRRGGKGGNPARYILRHTTTGKRREETAQDVLRKAPTA